jgi:hypothetical protein
MGPQIRRAIDDYNGIVSPPNRAPIIAGFEQELAQTLARNNNTIPGAAYQSLRSRMDAVARNAPPEVADTLRGVKNALDHAMERHLQRTGSSDLGAWQQARREYRNLLPIERAATGPGSDTAAGLISPSALRNAVTNQSRRGYARGTGDLSRLARSGEAVMKTLPQSGTAPRSYMANLVGAGGLGAVGTGVATGNPLLLAGGLATVLGPPAAGAALMSRPVQNFLSRPQPQNYGPAASLLGMSSGSGQPALPQFAGAQMPFRPGEQEQNFVDSINGRQGLPNFHWVNPAGVDAFLASGPMSTNIEDWRGYEDAFPNAAERTRRGVISPARRR